MSVRPNYAFRYIDYPSRDVEEICSRRFTINKIYYFEWSTGFNQYVLRDDNDNVFDMGWGEWEKIYLNKGIQ